MLDGQGATGGCDIEEEFGEMPLDSEFDLWNYSKERNDRLVETSNKYHY